MKELSIIIVNHNHGEMLKQTVISIYESPDFKDYQIIIIDNKPNDIIIDWIANNYPNILILKNKKPKGYASNVNIGIKTAGKKKYILIVNPDIIVKPYLFSRLINYMEINKKVGISGPKLLNMNGTLQYSGRMFSTPLTTVIRGLKIESLPICRQFNKKYLMHSFSHTESRAVDWVTGALMIIRFDALTNTGIFDDKSFFLYSEDQDLCARMWKNNWEVHYVSHAEAFHNYLREGVNNIFSKHFYYQITSTIKLFNKYNWKITR